MSGTGWAWQHARHHCDLPTYFALCEAWQEVPPPAVQLRRIAQFLGLPTDAAPGRAASPSAASTPSTPQEIAVAAAQAGMHAFEGRPSDPMLDLID